MRKPRVGTILSAVGAVGTLSWTSVAAAQESPTDDQSTSTEIVVTAERRGPQSNLDTPLSISATEGATLEARGTRTVSDVLQATPGVGVFQFQPGQSFIQIRGISATTGDATVGYYLDDLPFTLINLSYVPDINPFDLQRIEVLRGPQGTLYGASSEGGTVRILTNNADPRRLEARGGFFVSSTRDGGDNFGFQGALNIPIVRDRVAVRFSGDYADTSGFFDNPTLGLSDINPSTTRNLRGKLTLRPVDGLEMRGMIWNARNRTRGGITANDNYDRPVSLRGEFFNNDMNLYNGAVEFSRPWGTLYSTTSWIAYDINALTGQFAVPSGTIAHYDAFNEEVRFASHFGGRFEMTAGFFYLNAREGLRSTIGPATFQIDQLQSEQWAVFGEGHLNITDRLSLTAGARYFEDQRAYSDQNPNNLAALTRFGVSPNRSAQFSKVTPRVNLAYRWPSDMMIYANVAEGFRSGLLQLDSILINVLNRGQVAPIAVDEENVWTYEVGLKAPLLGRTLALELALYYNDWQNLQLTTTTLVTLPTGPAVVAFVQNAGNAHAIGGDISLVFRGIRGLTLQASANANHSVYASDVPGTAGIREGDRLANVPAFNFSAFADYQWPLGSNGLRGVVRTSFSYSSPRRDYSAGQFRESGHLSFWNARAGIQRDNWGVFATVENLLDERDPLENLVALGALHARPRPRTIGVAGQLRF